MGSNISLVSQSPDVGVLTLTRPDSLDSLDTETLRNLTEADQRFRTAGETVVRIRGAGLTFSAGRLRGCGKTRFHRISGAGDQAFRWMFRFGMAC